MKLIIALIIFLTGAGLAVNGQSFRQQYNEFTMKKDTVGQLSVLKKWEAADSSDPELYVSYFNYYVNRSVTTLLEIGNNPAGKEALQINSTDTTQNDPIAYMYDKTVYDSGLLDQGLYYADRGITKNPSRLDIRFGKVYMYGETERWEKFTEEIIKVVEYSAVIKNNWTWADSKPVKDPEKFMLQSIQDYQIQLYNTNNDDLLDNMKRIAETVLKYYPENVESLSNLSIVYMIKKEYPKALVPLLQAEKLAPADFIVLNNIAEAYRRQGDKANAIIYYEKLLKNGDGQAREHARKSLEELKK